jgi:hypothetical protein
VLHSSDRAVALVACATDDVEAGGPRLALERARGRTDGSRRRSVRFAPVRAFGVLGKDAER